MRKRTITDHFGYVSRVPSVKAVRCGKTTFASKKQAKAAANQQRRTGDNVQAYHCYKCHGYHLGHSADQPRRLDEDVA